MRTLVIAEHPEWAARIRSGEKTSELRRVLPRKTALMPGDRVALYETAPVGKVTTEFTVEACGYREIGSKADSERMARRACVPPDSMPEYVKERPWGGGQKSSGPKVREVGEIVVMAGSVRTLEEPKKLSDYELSWAPQSWAWARKEG
jgi:predicted transcriptional regulator